MTEWRVGDLVQHRCGDIGIVLKLVEEASYRGSVAVRPHVLIRWLDEDGMDDEAWPHSLQELKLNCEKLVSQ